MIKVQQISKRRGDRTVFHRLNFSWSQPEIICVSGANGSGKTTLLSMLAGALPPDDGDILVFNRSLVHQHHTATELIAYAPDDCPIYPFITGREWLAFVKSVRAVDVNTEQNLISGFGLQAHLDSQFGAMSLGTAKKCLLTSVLMCPAPLLILDEPTNGLDETSLEVLRHYLNQRQTNSLIILSCLDPMQQQHLGARSIELHTLEQA